MTTIISTDPHIMQLEFALIRLDKRWHELAAAAQAVCNETATETEAVARLRALVTPGRYPPKGDGLYGPLCTQGYDVINIPSLPVTKA